MKLVRATSTEYVEAKLSAFNPSTSAAIDLSGDVVQVAFTQPGIAPTTGDWRNATWTYPGIAGILVGPGALVLAVGDYDWYIRVADTPENPVNLVDTLRII